MKHEGPFEVSDYKRKFKHIQTKIKLYVKIGIIFY